MPNSSLKIKNSSLFPRYPAYKDSGVEWIGEIPEGWEMKKLKFMITINNGTDHKHVISDTGYPVYGSGGQFAFASRYLFDGDAILLGRKGTIDKPLIVTGKFWTVDTMFYATLHTQNSIEFVYYSSKLIPFSYYSTATALPSMTQSDLNNHEIVLPPKSEQTAIVHFLDEKTAKIDEAIRQKQRMIELLHERKQILIQSAVTGGLIMVNDELLMINGEVVLRKLDQAVQARPNADGFYQTEDGTTIALHNNTPALLGDSKIKHSKLRTKHSNIEWIGKIPEHWEVKRGKFLFFESDERSGTGDEELLSVSHISGVTPRSEKDVNMFLAEDYSGSKLCHAGDVVYNIMWAWMGALGVSPCTGIVSPSYGVYRQRTETFDDQYLEWLLQSLRYCEYYNKVSTGLHSSRLRFYSHMFMDMFIGFPPLKEQRKIVSFVTKSSGRIDSAILEIEQQIEKLKEYRVTLIDSAVTGKIMINF